MSESILDHGYLPEEHAPDPVTGHGDPTPPGKVAIWLFLASEVMFFIGLLATYIIFRSGSPKIFAEHAGALSKTLAGINTLVLIGSSLTMALAVWAAQTSRRMLTVWMLLATLILGSVFVGVKGYEYYDHIHHGLLPGQNFTYVHAENPALTPGIQLFMVFYFSMTGLHALHMIVGAGLLLWFMYRAWRGDFGPEYYAPVEIMGLYWHFVDIVWIFLFPLLYLSH